MLDLKPSKSGYVHLGEDTLSMVISSDISVAPKSILIKMFGKLKENGGWMLENFQKVGHSLDIHRILAEDDHSNWLEQQPPR
ncbi:hypothetical protein V6N12_032958 [Hibiscus sabdariffa]|uniref:Uncharacterized protein n=1 Tax=Hibiscus sabdariffa TaxID=183260 RepID=A0ABR2BEY1_9ROSI